MQRIQHLYVQSPLQDIVATSSFSATQLITAVVVTFLLTCVSALVIGTLLGVLIMKRFLNPQAQSKLQKQQAEPAEGTYEMVRSLRKQQRLSTKL